MLVIILLIGLVHRGSTNGAFTWEQELEDPDPEPLTPDELMPKILSSDVNIVAAQGEDVMLNCDVLRLGKYSIIWQKEDTILWVLQGTPSDYNIQYVTKDKRISRNNTSLIIKDLKAADEGEYSCQVSSIAGQIVNYILAVNVPPSIQVKGHGFFMKIQGEEASLECEATGKPQPEITWKKLGSYENVTLDSKGPLLTLSDLRRSDAGDYACIADNNVGEPSTAIASLVVSYPPIVRALLETVQSGVNYDATLLCEVDAIPSARIEWYKEGNPVNPMRLRKGYEKKNKFSLFFERVHYKDFGFYSCNATNFFGNDSAVIELTGRPAIPRVGSEPEGSFPDNYTLLWDVKSYAPITNYFLLLKNLTTLHYEEEDWVNITVPGKSSPSMYHSQSYTFFDLSPGTSLVVKIQANNEFGNSEFSDLFMFKTSLMKEENFEEESIHEEFTALQNTNTEIQEDITIEGHTTEQEVSEPVSNSTKNLLIQMIEEFDDLQGENVSSGSRTMVDRLLPYAVKMISYFVLKVLLYI